MRPGAGRRRSQTRARLLSAAFSVFAAKGFGRVSIEEICAAAGFSRGAFYSNFDSLEALLHALYEEQVAVLCGRVAQVFLDTGADTVTSYDCSHLTERLAGVLWERRWLLVEADFRAHAARHPVAAQMHRAGRRRLADAVVHGLLARDTAPPPPGLSEEAARAVRQVCDAVSAQLILDGNLEQARERLACLLRALASHVLEAAEGQSTASDRPGLGPCAVSWCSIGDRGRSVAAGSP
ncbi:TetR/AcrR family transcriptional regulator [Streptomyces sp. NPDC006654]|uniref:TetR/AcrR family transcriptional regulator n=1 Tax=Streptomyces sp. NPDC006654 TaxID=3156897 RepID=UPI0033E7CEE6